MFVVSISVHSYMYNMPVMFIGMLLAAGEFFADCQRPRVLVNVIASNGCQNGKFKSHHYIKKHP